MAITTATWATDKEMILILEIMQFIFGNFWTWAGMTIIIALLTCWSPIKIIISKEDHENDKK